MRISITLLVFLALLVAPAAAAADGKMSREAKVHYDSAIELYSAGKYRQASDAFYRAYKAEKRVEILFGWAQSKRLSGDCEGAVKLYRKMLKRKLQEADEKAVYEGLKECGAKVADDGREADDEQDEPAEDAPDEAEELSDDEEVLDDSGDEEAEVDDGEEDRVETSKGSGGGSPWYTDPIGDAMLITGVIGLGVGTGYFLVSSSDRSAADEATNYESYVTLADRASSRRTIAILATSASGALIVGAIVRYVMRDDGSSAEKGASLSAWTSSDGAGLAIGGRF